MTMIDLFFFVLEIEVCSIINCFFLGGGAVSFFCWTYSNSRPRPSLWEREKMWIPNIFLHKTVVVAAKSLNWKHTDSPLCIIYSASNSKLWHYISEVVSKDHSICRREFRQYRTTTVLYKRTSGNMVTLKETFVSQHDTAKTAKKGNFFAFHNVTVTKRQKFRYNRKKGQAKTFFFLGQTFSKTNSYKLARFFFKGAEKRNLGIIFTNSRRVCHV